MRADGENCASTSDHQLCMYSLPLFKLLALTDFVIAVDAVFCSHLAITGCE